MTEQRERMSGERLIEPSNFLTTYSTRAEIIKQKDDHIQNESERLQHKIADSLAHSGSADHLLQCINDDIEFYREVLNYKIAVAENARIELFKIQREMVPTARERCILVCANISGASGFYHANRRVVVIACMDYPVGRDQSTQTIDYRDIIFPTNEICCMVSPSKTDVFKAVQAYKRAMGNLPIYNGTPDAYPIYTSSGNAQLANEIPYKLFAINNEYQHRRSRPLDPETISDIIHQHRRHHAKGVRIGSMIADNGEIGD